MSGNTVTVCFTRQCNFTNWSHDGAIRRNSLTAIFTVGTVLLVKPGKWGGGHLLVVVIYSQQLISDI